MTEYKLPFDPKWIDPILKGEKTATIRLEPPELGDSIFFMDNEDYDVFAIGYGIQQKDMKLYNVPRYIKEQSLSYPNPRMKDMLNSLSEYYEDIHVNAIVTVVWWNKVVEA